MHAETVYNQKKKQKKNAIDGPVNNLSTDGRHETAMNLK